MRAVVQRVSEAAVTAEGRETGRIGRGLLVLLSVEDEDTAEDARYMAGKLVGLRIFSDADGKFNLSVGDVGGAVLLISQFTLHGDCRKGRRPSFIRAARPEKAEPMYRDMAQLLRDRGFEVAMGVFGAHMDVHLVNDGPVTLLIDSKKVF